MKEKIPRTINRLTSDLLFVHPPAFFDFRNQDKIYFPYLSTSGDVPITPLYEYFPMGFKTLKKYLGDRNFDVKILNLSTLLLKYPSVDLEALLKNIEVKIFGVDLHWMVHVQGSLEIASLLKKIHPESYLMLGGISSTYYADELIKYPFIDFVMRGYDTHKPMALLMDAVKQSSGFETVPNLLWKRPDKEIVDNKFEYTPSTLHAGIDWSDIPQNSTEGFAFPIKEMLSTSNIGCTSNCGWCGGSRDAFRRVNQCDHSIIHKDLPDMRDEINSMRLIEDIDKHHFYLCGTYNESQNRINNFLKYISALKLKSISYEQYFLTPDDILKKMSQANEKTIITLSPESPDIKIAKLAGRGAYTMDEMEKWIERALDYGIYEIDIWFFIGMPEQDSSSVYETVDYCRKLLKKFRGKRVVPLLCPMIPFLDPASNFFESPSRHGYKVFYRTVEEHRNGMLRASLINRINYETRWLSREQLVDVSYQAVKKLFEIKGEYGALPEGITESVISKIDDAVKFIHVVHEIDCIVNDKERQRELEKISGEIKRRNNNIFYHGVANQTFPINREIGGRWIDEIPWNLDGNSLLNGLVSSDI
ncbi:MAG TPA: cobalamin-dependent protein [Ruminiclostridium sp.]|nr:cobalamin-dependent protein [Ruminiclostridium sp.]